MNIRFSNSNAQSCKFLTQYLEANRLDYVLKDREDYKEVVALPDIFALTLSTKGAYRSPVVKDNLYDAIIKRSNDIELAHNAIREFKRNVKIIDAKLADMQDDLSKSEYARSIDNITKEILEFKHVKEVEALGQNLLVELQEKAAKWAENELNISEWIRVGSLNLRLRMRIRIRNSNRIYIFSRASPTFKYCKLTSKYFTSKI